MMAYNSNDYFTIDVVIKRDFAAPFAFTCNVTKAGVLNWIMLPPQTPTKVKPIFILCEHNQLTDLLISLTSNNHKRKC